MGDLSPEASFLSGQRRSSTRPVGSTRGEVGVWLGHRPEVRHHLSDERHTNTADSHTQGASAAQRPGLTGLASVIPRLRQECLSILPPPFELETLTRIYFSKVDPIFPILKGEDLDTYQPQETAAFKQCICLVAALDPKARDHLRLPSVDRLLTPIEFRSQLAAAVKQSLDLGFIENKVVLLQICALMGFHGEQANCSEVSSLYASQAVHHAQTLGVHLGWPEDERRMAKSRCLFGCVWFLDRLNAAANGRPVLMHQQDIDRKMLTVFSEQEAPFKLLIRITQILDDVIGQYRPHSGTLDPAEAGSTSFKSLVQSTGATSVGTPMLGQ